MQQTPRYRWLVGLALGLVLLISPLFSQAPEEGDGPPKGIFDQATVADSEPAPAQEGVEPLAKGVIHEAFAVPTVFAAQSGTTVAKEAPQPIEELPPEQKPEGANVQWINGYFAYEEEKKDFIWVSGIWRNIPPSMQWVPGAWNQVTDGYQYFSGFWKRASEGDLQVVPMPPEPLVTADPPAPNAESTYVPGSWIYRETRYVWRPACWAAHRPGWVWVPARYQWTRCGYVFIEGYYDYALQDRGLLYCPVYISPTYYGRANWFYRPQYVVHDQCLLSCLFVQRRTGCYYFGNYYDDAYLDSGYVAWTSYRVNRQYEPLFFHYRHVYRNDPRWETNLAKLQVARYKGDAPRPPVNLLLQTKAIKNNTTNINNLVLIAPMNQINKKVVPLAAVDATELKKHVQNIAKMNQASLLRAKNETSLAKTIGTVKIGDQSKTLALNLPNTTVATVLTTKIKNLPPPPQGNKGQILLSGKDNPTTDKSIPPKDKDTVTSTKDKGTTPKDKGTSPTDKGTTPKDKGTSPTDKGTTPKDKGTSPKDKSTSPTDKGTNPKDKGTSPKDKVTSPTDKVIILPKDKGPSTTIPLDKGTTPKGTGGKSSDPPSKGDTSPKGKSGMVQPPPNFHVPLAVATRIVVARPDNDGFAAAFNG